MTSSEWVCPWGDALFTSLAQSSPDLVNVQLIDQSTFDKKKTNLINPLQWVTRATDR
eukprot:gene35376-43617_t